MPSNWIIAIAIKEWNQFLKMKILENINAPKISDGDLMCFYVVGTSSIKGIGKKLNGGIHLEKIGDLNYFGISDRLEFVKDKESVIKYLKNFHGIANLGKPFSSTDMEVIASEMTPLATRTEGAVEKQIELKDTSLKPGSAYETMFNLEVSLRNFVSNELNKISRNWLNERIPDPKMLQRWKERKGEATKQRAWFEHEENAIIHFSDFYDLVTLIVNRGNWKMCFGKTFGKQSIIESKMYELIPIRNKLAHNRALTDEEIMALSLYSRQILRRINDGNEKVTL